MAVTIGEFLERLEATGIFDASTLDEVRSDAETHGGAEADAEAFVRHLHGTGRLTGYQAKLLWKNRGSQLVLGNYVVEEELGRGGMGVVLKGRHARMQRNVAIKVLPASMAKDGDAIARFHREVQAAAQLMHPNIVSAHDANEFDGRHALIMEFVDGRDLSAVVKKKGPLSVDQAIDCVIQAARGLEFAHGKGVVHRDIKPANLLLDSKGRVKILDMGLARFSEAADVGSMAELTGSGTIMGTVDYMSPEQAVSTRNADERSDVYSLGITLWYLLTARPAYPGDSLMSRMLAHANDPIPKLRDVRTDVPESVETVFERMVAKEPEARMQTMTEVVAAFEACRDGTSGTVVTARARGSEEAVGGERLSNFLGSLDEDSAPGEVSRILTKKRDRQRTGEPDSQTAVSDAATGTVRSRPELPTTQPSVPAMRGVRWTDWRLLSGVGGVLAVALVAVMTWSGPDESDDPASILPPAGAEDDPALAKVPGLGASGSVNQSESVSADPVLVGHALEFDGTGYVNVPSLRHDYASPLTLEAWVRYDAPARPPARQYVIADAQRGGVGLRIDKGREWFAAATVADLGWQPRTPVDPKRGWQHVAFVFEAEEIRLFVDGELRDRRGAPGLRIPPSQESFVIGAQPGGAGAFIESWTGAIDEVRVSNVARYTDDFEPARRFEPDAGTMALYHCDAARGTVLKDASGNAHHGRIVRARWVPADQPASPDPRRPTSPSTEPALAFDGVNDHVRLPTLKYDAKHSLTLEAWVTPRALKGTQALPNGGESPQSFIGNAENAGVGMGVREGGLWQVVLHDPGNADPLGTYAFVNSDETLVLGRRTHVAGVVDLESRELRLYVDGVRQSKTSKLVGPHKPSNLPFLLGADVWGRGPKWQFPFDGLLHGVRISKGIRYTEDFTPDRRWTPDANTLAKYNFDEGTGNTLHDTSGNGYDGTIVGAEWVSAVADPSESTSGFGLEFDGIDDSVVFESLVNDGGPYTLEAKVRLSEVAVGPSNFVFAFRGPATRGRIAVGPVGFVHYRLVGPTLHRTRETGAAPKADRWYDVAATWDGEVGRLFVDGEPVGSEWHPVFAAEPSTSPTTLGRTVSREGTFEGASMRGVVRELRVSKMVRYDGSYEPATVLEADGQTVALFDFAEGRGNTLRDSSGNGHHGRIIGATWVRTDGTALPTPDAHPEQPFVPGDHVLAFEPGDSVTVPGVRLDPSKPFTVEFRTKPEAPHDGAAYFVRVDGMFVRLVNTTWQVGASRGNRSSFSWPGTDRTPPPRGAHVAAVGDGREFRLYVDGRRIAGGPISPDLVAERRDLEIGGGLQGTIDELRLSTVARYTADYVPAQKLESDEDTLALYHFDEGRGTKLKDSSGNGHHGTIAGARWVRVRTPRIVSALDFDGVDDHVRLPTLKYDGSHDFTVEAWITPRALVGTGEQDRDPDDPNFVYRGEQAWIGNAQGSGMDLLQHRDGVWGMAFHNAGHPGAVNRYAYALSKAPVELRRPVHVAGVVNLGERRLNLFVDGVRSSIVTLEGRHRGSTLPFMLGGDPKRDGVTPSLPCKGRLHRVRFSNVARYTDDFVPEVNWTPDAETLALYRFDEGEGTTLKDASGNGHDGEIVGATWVRGLEPMGGYSGPAEIDLLSLVEPQRDSVNGIWARNGSRLVAAKGQFTRVVVPYALPQEYDLVLRATPEDGYKELGIGFTTAGAKCLFKTDCFKTRGSFSGLALVDGKEPTEHDAAKRGRHLEIGEQVTIEIHVRRGHVSAVVDGERVLDWTGSGDQLSLPPSFAVPEQTTCFLYAHQTGVRFDEFTLQVPESNRTAATPDSRAVASGNDYDGLATGEWIDVLAVEPPEASSTAALSDGVLTLSKPVEFSRFDHRNAIVRARVRHAGARNVSFRLRSNGRTTYYGWVHAPTDGLVGFGFMPDAPGRYRDLLTKRLKSEQFSPDSDGFFEIAFAVVDDKLSFFVDGAKVLEHSATHLDDRGNLGLTIPNGRGIFKDVQFMSLDTSEE